MGGATVHAVAGLEVQMWGGGGPVPPPGTPLCTYYIYTIVFAACHAISLLLATPILFKPISL